ncbi:MAG: metallophosphoesterase [Lentisphaerae bacterium]|nr:metallophosphoesterase [Lentisphaerota bacterium]
MAKKAAKMSLELVSSLVFKTPVAVIGDIHGSLDLLVRLLEQIGDIPIIVTGDVCDHGPDTKGVIDLLIARGALGVRGNHEEWFLNWAEGKGFDSFALSKIMGGRATLDSYGVKGTTPREIESESWRVQRSHVEWLKELPLAIDLEVMGQRYWILHAGIPANLPEYAGLRPNEIIPWVINNRPRDINWGSKPPEKVP